MQQNHDDNSPSSRQNSGASKSRPIQSKETKKTNRRQRRPSSKSQCPSPPAQQYSGTLHQTVTEPSTSTFHMDLHSTDTNPLRTQHTKRKASLKRPNSQGQKYELSGGRPLQFSPPTSPLQQQQKFTQYSQLYRPTFSNTQQPQSPIYGQYLHSNFFSPSDNSMKHEGALQSPIPAPLSHAVTSSSSSGFQQQCSSQADIIRNLSQDPQWLAQYHDQRNLQHYTGYTSGYPFPEVQYGNQNHLTTGSILTQPVDTSQKKKTKEKGSSKGKKGGPKAAASESSQGSRRRNLDAKRVKMAQSSPASSPPPYKLLFSPLSSSSSSSPPKKAYQLTSSIGDDQAEPIFHPPPYTLHDSNREATPQIRELVETEQSSTTRPFGGEAAESAATEQSSSSLLFESETFESVEDMLNVKEANWFLDILEAYNESRLTPEDQEKLRNSNLRSKIKHRASILFFEDVDFILRMEHNLQLDMENPKCRRDPKKWIIHKLCQVIVEKYPHSIQNKANRSCIWSAMMERALFHLQESGFTDASIETHGDSNREATLFIGDYHVSRSNFTKVFKRYCK